MNIAVFLDGTWNDRNANTNVVQLYDRCSARDAAGARQLAYYDEGVGTARFERVRGGVLGRGLDRSIRAAYRFIASAHGGPGDDLFILGYSRGAFAARSLAGMIAKCGLVRPDRLPVDRVFARYRRGREAAGLREMREGEAAAASAEDRVLLEHSLLVRIRFVGAFDTVGSLGVPGRLRGLTAWRYRFHDTNLSGLVDHACHAVAIDEHRPDFEATLWTGVPIPIPGHATTVEQAWFVGSHPNVGGGGTAAPERDNALSTLTREWMAERARAAGLALEPPAAPAPSRPWEGPIVDSYARFLGGAYGRLPWNRRHLRPVRTAIGERLDRSVLERWGGDPDYRPGNAGLAGWVGELAG